MREREFARGAILNSGVAVSIGSNKAAPGTITLERETNFCSDFYLRQLFLSTTSCSRELAIRIGVLFTYLVQFVGALILCR